MYSKNTTLLLLGEGTAACDGRRAFGQEGAKLVTIV
jgi:hypothetical protein